MLLFIRSKKIQNIFPFGYSEGSWGLGRHSRQPATISVQVVQALGHSRHSGTRRAVEHLDTRGTLFRKLLKTVSSYYATLISPPVSPIRKHLSPLVFVSQG